LTDPEEELAASKVIHLCLAYYADMEIICDGGKFIIRKPGDERKTFLTFAEISQKFLAIAKESGSVPGVVPQNAFTTSNALRFVEFLNFMGPAYPRIHRGITSLAADTGAMTLLGCLFKTIGVTVPTLSSALLPYMPYWVAVAGLWGGLDMIVRSVSYVWNRRWHKQLSSKSLSTKKSLQLVEEIFSTLSVGCFTVGTKPSVKRAIKKRKGVPKSASVITRSRKKKATKKRARIKNF
jgi:hypothetical protein